jgi:hypothetical protein
MKLSEFMDDAYQGLTRGRRLETRQGDTIFSLEDLADRVGTKPSRNAVEELVPQDKSTLIQLIDSDPGKTYQLLWGISPALQPNAALSPCIFPLEIMQGWS